MLFLILLIMLNNVIKRKTPAVTIVAACNKAETG
jgi:hypothetical protein